LQVGQLRRHRLTTGWNGKEQQRIISKENNGGVSLLPDLIRQWHGTVVLLSRLGSAWRNKKIAGMQAARCGGLRLGSKDAETLSLALALNVFLYVYYEIMNCGPLFVKI